MSLGAHKLGPQPRLPRLLAPLSTFIYLPSYRWATTSVSLVRRTARLLLERHTFAQPVRKDDWSRLLALNFTPNNQNFAGTTPFQVSLHASLASGL
jgi:hypothetical protein